MKYEANLESFEDTNSFSSMQDSRILIFDNRINIKSIPKHQKTRKTKKKAIIQIGQVRERGKPATYQASKQRQSKHKQQRKKGKEKKKGGPHFAKGEKWGML